MRDQAEESTSSRDDEVLREINKRLTLNLLIQGAAIHSFLTGHHVVKEELEAIRPGLTKSYDKLALGVALGYFVGDLVLFYGFPSWFWKRTHKASHPYHRHRLLATHGQELWRGSKRYLFSRAWRKWVIPLPVIQLFQSLYLLFIVFLKECRHRQKLEQLAKRANSLIWGIDEDRLDASLTMDVAFGNLQQPRTAVGRFTRNAAVGYGGVERRDGRFQVVAKAWSWPLVSHELTKGTMELICLHGLNTLDAEMYCLVTAEADQLEHENWLLQAGGEMWRRFLAVIPEGRRLSKIMMHVARLDPESLEELMMAVIEEPARARYLLDSMETD